MSRAVFLDRDGVLNRPLIRDGLPYAPTSLEEFDLLPGVKEACALLKNAGYLLVLATNQPDVGRGTMSRELVESMHAKLLSEVPLDRIEVSYAAGAAFGEPSEFRKPKPGMLKHAATELGIDLGQSWMIGDRWRDISAGHAAGCRTILIDYGYSEEFPDPPDFSVHSLGEAAEIVLRIDKSSAL
jgi:D-glycero-D-manno-heptose 1,7-bisphosphate phosphatase